MIQNNPMRNLCNYASSAVYKDPPSEDQIRNGVIPLDSLPAAWWNWLWNQTNGAVIEAKTAMNSVINELNSVLCAAGITPQSACMDQLYNAIDCLRQTLATTTVAGSVKSSTSCGKISVDENGIMTANGLGNVGNLTTVTKTNVVGAINELKDDYETCVGVLGNAIDGLDNSKAPINHASTETTYGLGNTTSYGHVKLSDTYAEAVGGVSEGIAASQKALNDMYVAITEAGYVTLGNTAGCNPVNDNPSAGSASTASRSDHTHTKQRSARAGHAFFIEDGHGISSVSAEELDKEDEDGSGMLVYRPQTWTCVTCDQWGLGAISAQGVIRSSNYDLLHYRHGSGLYCIWDSGNFKPSNYMPKSGGTFTGNIAFPENHYADNAAIHLNNSDIKGANVIWFDDTAEASEGLAFKRGDNSYYDMLSVCNGHLYVIPTGGSSTAAVFDGAAMCVYYGSVGTTGAVRYSGTTVCNASSGKVVVFPLSGVWTYTRTIAANSSATVCGISSGTHGYFRIY